MRRVLLLGGVDPCGGAGITADATVVAVHGAWPLPIAVALTAQNRHGFEALAAVPDTTWQRALRAALADGEVHAVKVGLLGGAATVAAVAEALTPLKIDRTNYDLADAISGWPASLFKEPISLTQ